MAKTSPSTAGGTGSTPGQGTKIPHAVQRGQKEKKKKKVNIELPYDPAIPLISICPKELKTGTHTNPYTRVFTAASLTIAKRWKQPKCPSADDAINKLWKIIPP